MTMRTRAAGVIIIACLAGLAAARGSEVRTPADAQARDAAAASRGTAVLTGRVLHESAPIGRAVVTISAEAAATYRTTTDDEGRFAFEGLPAGRYLITASKPGWVTSQYGATPIGRGAGVRVPIEDGGRVTVDVPIVRGAVIAGRVVDRYGQPMVRQQPELRESRVIGGRRTLGPAALPDVLVLIDRFTDSRGEFRFFGLAPGTYYLVMTPSPLTAGTRLTTSDEVRWATQPPGAPLRTPPPGPTAGYTTIYYPGTPNVAAAQPIVVGAGDVREGLVLQVDFVPVGRISGIVRRPDGAPAAGAQLNMRRQEPLANPGRSSNATAGQDGRYTFTNVPPGDYRLTVGASAAGGLPMRGRGAASTLDLWGQADLVVTGQDLDSADLSLTPGSVVTGQLVFDGTEAMPNPATVRVDLASVGFYRAGGGGGLDTQTAAVDASGAFRFASVPPGQHVLSASWSGQRTIGRPDGWWMIDVVVGGAGLGDRPLDVGSGANIDTVRIHFRDRIGVVEGTITDAAGRAALDSGVIVFPVDRESWVPWSRRIPPPARPATDGRYRVYGLPAGEYYVAVLVAPGREDTQDPAVLEAAVPSAIRLTLADGETRRLDLRAGR